MPRGSDKNGCPAFRPEVAPPSLTRTVAGLDRSRRCTGIDLAPLDHDEVAVLVEAVLVEAGAIAKPAAEMLARIVAMAQGNPFFALELIRGIGEAADAAVARSVWEAITERFLDLDDATAAMLRRLAVAGDDLDPVDVPALTGLAEPDAFALLDAALDAGSLVVSLARYARPPRSAAGPQTGTRRRAPAARRDPRRLRRVGVDRDQLEWPRLYPALG